MKLSQEKHTLILKMLSPCYLVAFCAYRILWFYENHMDWIGCFQPHQDFWPYWREWREWREWRAFIRTSETTTTSISLYLHEIPRYLRSTKKINQCNAIRPHGYLSLALLPLTSEDFLYSYLLQQSIYLLTYLPTNLPTYPPTYYIATTPKIPVTYNSALAKSFNASLAASLTQQWHSFFSSIIAFLHKIPLLIVNTRFSDTLAPPLPRSPHTTNPSFSQLIHSKI